MRRSLVLFTAVACAAVLAAASAGRPAPSHPVKPGVFPVTVKAANGKVLVRREPRRIISLSPTATESLFAIGAGRQVIAVDDQSDYPAGAPKTKLSGLTPNTEAIAGYRPDLVVVSFDANRIVAALGKLKIPVLLQTPAPTLAAAYEQIEQLGLATGRVGGSRALVKKMKAQITALVARAPRSRSLSVFHEISPDFYSATSKTFVGRVYALFGLRNIADEADKTGSGYPQLSAEYILAADPDLVVLADTKCCGQTPATAAARPGWSKLTAVQRGAIARIDDSIASRWGPRVVNFVRAVSRALKTVAAGS